MISPKPINHVAYFTNFEQRDKEERSEFSSIDGKSESSQLEIKK